MFPFFMCGPFSCLQPNVFGYPFIPRFEGENQRFFLTKTGFLGYGPLVLMGEDDNVPKGKHRYDSFPLHASLLIISLAPEPFHVHAGRLNQS